MLRFRADSIRPYIFVSIGLRITSACRTLFLNLNCSLTQKLFIGYAFAEKVVSNVCEG